MNKKLLLVCVLVALGVGLFFFNKNSGPASVSDSKLKVTASFYPLYFFSQEIGGDKADVFNITPAGAEPHDYEPTAQDMVRVEDSQIIVLNGGGLEAWGDNLRQSIDPSRTLIINAGEDLATQGGGGGVARNADPHLWLSPPEAAKMVDKIAGAFAQADSANSDYYEKNAAALTLKLAQLDESYRAGLSACKEKNIITSHAAFGYVAATYGFTQVSIAGLSPDAEPSLQELRDITTFAKKNNVKYIFFESLVSPKLSNTIAREVGAQTLVLNPIEGLSREELRQGKNYFTEMESNLTNLQVALQCQP